MHIGTIMTKSFAKNQLNKVQTPCMVNNTMKPTNNSLQKNLANDVTKWLVKYMTGLYVLLLSIHLFAVAMQPEPEPLTMPFEHGNIYMLNITRVA